MREAIEPQESWAIALRALETTVLGEGLLAGAITGNGEPRRASATTLPEMLHDRSVVVVASDGWDTRPYSVVRKVCAGQGVPWLPVRTELGRAVIGPVELPGYAGCATCAELRRRLARRHPQGHDAVWHRHESALADRPSSWLTNPAADLIAALVADEVRRIGRDPGSARTRCALLYVDLEDLNVTTHRFLPDPLCRDCGDLPDDTAALAHIWQQSRPKPAPGSYRVRAVTEELDDLEATYVDAESGLVRTFYEDAQGGLVVAAAPMGLRNDTVEFGYGRSRNYRTSRLTAMLEALERSGGMAPGGKRTIITAEYAEVRDRAVDPRTLGVHPAECYKMPGFRFRPFDDAALCRWVWAYSFAREAPILVPEALAYYGVPHAEPEFHPFVYETSNGCALGGCLEEAILYGILEVAERDAFLMTWSTHRPASRIDLGSARDRTVPLIAEAIQAEMGYQVTAFDITLEQNVPCVWAMGVDLSGNDKRPKAACAAGSHLDPERAAENALSELGPSLADLIRRYPEQRDHAREMAKNPSLVTEMSDHSLLYANPEAFGRLRFLTGSARVCRLDGLSPQAGFRNADLRDDLAELLRRYLDSGLDVIVVDQTTLEHRAGGFACVKVIIPGTLPMTFGHNFRRVHGLPRLFEVPTRLGYHDRPLRERDINPDPHPFP